MGISIKKRSETEKKKIPKLVKIEQSRAQNGRKGYRIGKRRTPWKKGFFLQPTKIERYHIQSFLMISAKGDIKKN